MKDNTHKARSWSHAVMLASILAETDARGMPRYISSDDGGGLLVSDARPNSGVAYWIVSSDWLPHFVPADAS